MLYYEHEHEHEHELPASRTFRVRRTRENEWKMKMKMKNLLWISKFRRGSNVSVEWLRLGYLLSYCIR